MALITLPPRYRLPLRLALLLGVAVLGCRPSLATLVEPSRSAVALTAGPTRSMVYLARVDSGIVAIDLGWWGGTRAVRRALAGMGATEGDVTHVFLTHSHRDHIGAWRLVRTGRFHVSQPEKDALLGGAAHDGWIPREADRLRPSDLPREGELTIQTFSRDTAFALGADTLHAYVVPGHTAGSTVYLFRGILFVGDAVSYTPIGGFRPALAVFSDDADVARENLTALWERLPAGAVRTVCTAHAECADYSRAWVQRLHR